MNNELKAVILKEAKLGIKRLILTSILSICAFGLTFYFFPNKLLDVTFIFTMAILFNVGVISGIMLLAAKIKHQ